MIHTCIVRQLRPYVCSADGSYFHGYSVLRSADGSYSHGYSVLRSADGSYSHEYSVLRSADGSYSHEYSVVRSADWSYSHEYIVLRAQTAHIHDYSGICKNEYNMHTSLCHKTTVLINTLFVFRLLSDLTCSDRLLSDLTCSDRLLSDLTCSDRLLIDFTCPERLLSDLTCSDRLLSDLTCSDRLLSDLTCSDCLLSDLTCSETVSKLELSRNYELVVWIILFWADSIFTIFACMLLLFAYRFILLPHAQVLETNSCTSSKPYLTILSVTFSLSENNDILEAYCC